MSTPKQYIETVKFFWNHAGYSWSPLQGETEAQGRGRAARALADAEDWAFWDAELEFLWSVDPDVTSADWSDEEPAYAVWQCVVEDPDGNVLATVGGVDFGRDRDPWMDDYRRVVEAELALECM